MRHVTLFIRVNMVFSPARPARERAPWRGVKKHATFDISKDRRRVHRVHGPDNHHRSSSSSVVASPSSGQPLTRAYTRFTINIHKLRKNAARQTLPQTPQNSAWDERLDGTRVYCFLKEKSNGERRPSSPPSPIDRVCCFLPRDGVCPVRVKHWKRKSPSVGIFSRSGITLKREEV